MINMESLVVVELDLYGHTDDTTIATHCDGEQLLGIIRHNTWSDWVTQLKSSHPINVRGPLSVKDYPVYSTVRQCDDGQVSVAIHLNLPLCSSANPR